jgi:flagellar biogenesis protein FliO
MESTNGIELNQDLPLCRKLEEFIENKEYKKFKIYMKLCYVIIFFGLSAYLVMSFIFRSQYLAKS